MQNNYSRCPQHLEKYLKYFCKNETCQEKRLFCKSCRNENKHLAHISKQQKIKKMPEFLEEIRSNCDHLVQFIETNFEEILQFKEYLIRAIRRKYHIQLQQFDATDIDTKCLIIDNLIKFKDDSKIIEQIMDQPFKAVLQHIQSGIKEVCLEQVTYFEQLNQQEHQQQQIYLNESKELFQFHRFEQALEKVNRALIINPRNVESINLKGDILIQLERQSEAAQQFKFALSIDQQNIKSMIGLGQYYQRIGQQVQATKYYLDVIGIDPSNTIATQNINQLVQ